MTLRALLAQDQIAKLLEGVSAVHLSRAATPAAS
jgi:hypothetical protein